MKLYTNVSGLRRAPGRLFQSLLVGWLVGCLTSQQHARVSQGRICTEVADPTFYLTQSQYTDTGPTSPSADPITPGAWQGSHWSVNFFKSLVRLDPEKSRRKRDSKPGSSVPEANAFITRPARRSFRRQLCLDNFTC